MTSWTDAHCHLDSENGDAEALLSRARSAGVGRFVAIGIGGAGKAMGEVRALAEHEPDVWFTAGIHPHDAADRTDDEVALVAKEAQHPRCVAVGEIGLDYFYDNSPRQAQADLFRELLSVADTTKKPAMLHIRDAHDDALKILSERPRAVPGVVHCFTGDWEVAQGYLALGFFLSIPGIVTFKTAAALADAVTRAPRDRIVVETDSPYLAPVPLRGRKNEPAFIVHTGRKIAELWNVPEEEVARVTSENAARLFGWS